MATFTAPTYEETIAREGLWRFYGITTEIIVWITTDGETETVFESKTPMDKALSQDAMSGTGEYGKSVFRYGKTYTINATEDAALQAAGYTTV